MRTEMVSDGVLPFPEEPHLALLFLDELLSGLGFLNGFFPLFGGERKGMMAAGDPKGLLNGQEARLGKLRPVRKLLDLVRKDLNRMNTGEAK